MQIKQNNQTDVQYDYLMKQKTKAHGPFRTTTHGREQGHCPLSQNYFRNNNGTIIWKICVEHALFGSGCFRSSFR
jgi:hypothetical protein